VPRAGNIQVIRAVFVVACLAPGVLAAQPPPECVPPDCGAGLRPAPDDQRAPAVQQIWQAAAQIHQLKLQFVAALRAFTQAQAGMFGDEGGRLASSVDQMRATLNRWDGAVRDFEAALSDFFGHAEVHLALGTVFLDRHRVRDALREFQAAARRDSTRADIFAVQALAYGLAGRTTDAAQALQRAATLDAGNAATWYTLGHYLLKLDRPEEARQALRKVHDAVQRLVDDPRAGSTGVVFDRVDLLRQVAGVAPIFPLSLYTDGYGALREGDYAAAVAHFRRAISRDPLTAERADASQAVAQAATALREGRLSEAVERLESAVRERPDRAEARRSLGLAYWIDEQHERSLEQLNAAVRDRPDDERARILRADVLISAGRWDEAEQALKDTIRIIPDSAQAHYRLGQLHQRQGALDDAVEAFERSAALGPISGMDHLFQTIGGVYVNQSRLDRAVEAYMRRVEVNPNSAEAHRQLGEIYFLQGRQDEALAEFSVAALIEPANARAWAGLGQVHLRERRHEDAVAALQEAVARGAADVETRYALGTALIRAGRAEEGRRQLDTSQRMRVDLMAAGQLEFQLDAIRREGLRHSSAGSHDEALALLNRLVTAAPGSAVAHRDLGLALSRAGRLDEAVSSLTRAQQLEATAEGHAYLADAYRVLGNLEESRRQHALRDSLLERKKIERLRELGGGR
jgi:tetratricopeptide (TPR) repeat protein